MAQSGATQADNAARRVLGGPGWWLAAAAVVVGAVIGFWPGAPAQTVSLVAPAALVVLVNLRAWRAYPGHPLRPSWLLLALGMTLTLAGEVVRIVDDLALLPIRQLIVGCNLAAYPFYVTLHLFRVWRLAGRNLSAAALLDALVCVLVVGALGAQAFLPLVGTVPLGSLIGLALPPLMTLAILLITCYLLYLSPRLPSPSALLLATVAATTTVANWLIAVRTFQPDSPSLVPLGLALLLISFLSLTSLPGLDRRPARAATDLAGPLLSVVVRSVPLLLVGLLAILVIGPHQPGLPDEDPLLLLHRRALALGTLLVLVRQWLVLRANATLVRALQETNQALTRAHEQAQREARTDPLTGLPNQRLLREYLETSLAYHRRTGQPLAVLFLDLDYFKTINDRFGHAAGDAALVEIGRRLRRAMREGDIVARYGGEEFVVLLPGTNAVDGLAVAERLRLRVGGEPIVLPGPDVATVTVSIGLVTSQGLGGTGEALLTAADAALYSAKQSGRDRVHQAGSMVAAD